MGSLGRPTTLIWRFSGTAAGTVSAVGVVDDVRAADSTPSSARACTAPKQAIFPAKSHQKPIKTRPKRPKGPRPAHSHTQPPGTLVSIFSHMPRMHVDRADRGRNYCVSPHRGVTRPVLTRPKKSPEVTFSLLQGKLGVFSSFVINKLKRNIQMYPKKR